MTLLKVIPGNYFRGGGSAELRTARTLSLTYSLLSWPEAFGRILGGRRASRHRGREEGEQAGNQPTKQASIQAAGVFICVTSLLVLYVSLRSSSSRNREKAWLEQLLIPSKN